MLAWRKSAWVAVAGLMLYGVAMTARASGDTYDVWLRHRDAVAKDPSVVRYYTFEGVTASSSKVNSVVGDRAPLIYDCYRAAGQNFEPLKLVEGRYPQKKAVRIDRGFFTAPPFAVGNKQMTVEAWLRTNGYGAIRGAPITYGGTLLSMGGGYWDGWRLTLDYPDRTIGFEIGRPKPGSAMGLTATGWTDGVWHYLAATWDGQRMCIYIDGALAASAEYAGDFTPPAPPRFTIGYADSGWGSVILDVDEVAIYKGALTAAEVLRSANYFAPLTDDQAARLAAGDQKLAASDTKAAAAEYEAVAKSPDPDVAAIAQLRVARALAQEPSYAAASEAMVKVLDGAGLSDRLKGRARGQLLLLYLEAPGDALPAPVLKRVLALGQMSPGQTRTVVLDLARAARRNKRFADARGLYAKVLAMKDLPPRERLDVTLELGHTCMEAGDFAGARAEYEKIAATKDALPQYRSYAMLLIARTYVRQKAWVAARRVYDRLAADRSAPAVHREEAREKVRELLRLRKGLPARDPARSHVKLPTKPNPVAKFYVATYGKDSNPGTLAKPFATLDRARQAVRDLRREGQLPIDGVAVYIRGGEYKLADTFTLGAKDTGTGLSPITYRNYRSEVVRFTGGVRVIGFKPVSDAAVLARLPAETRGKVLQADLRAQGITDYGQFKPYGYGFGPAPITELFVNGKPMQLARWPNQGFLRTGKILPGGKLTFQYEGDRPAHWKQPSLAEAFGYWVWDWAADTVGLASIDPAAHTVTLAQKPSYGVQAGRRFFFLNILEELDSPGEWYLDRERGIVYLYPPAGASVESPKTDVRLSMLEAPMVHMQNVSDVTLQGLTFETSRGDGIVLDDCSHCLIAACTVRDIAGTAVTINGGTGDGILGCDLYTLGRGGTRLIGGDRKTLTPGGHFVENCDIHDFSRLVRTYTPAVYLDGCGNRVSHNLIYDSPGHAMRIEGNDHIIEYNDVHDVVYESDDQGGLDIWFNPSYRGIIMRYNYWHDIGSGLTAVGQAGIRLDDAISGVHIYGNVFYKCSNANFGGIQINGGKDNILENNIFVDCKAAISLSAWGAARWKQFCESPRVIKATRQDVDITKPPYSTRYPALAHLEEHHDRNFIWRNLVYNCGQFLMRDPGVLDLMDNVVTSQDPGFVSVARGDFAIKPGSAIYDSFGFDLVPFNEIGPYKDRLRASWPPVDRVGARYVPPK